MTASLQGEILIKTRSIEEAIKSVDGLSNEIHKLGESNDDLKGLADEFKKTARESKQVAKDVTKLTTAQAKYDNLVAKAANTVANFSQRVSKSNASQEEKNRITRQAVNELDKYKRVLKATQTSSTGVQTANTQLSVSLGQLTRDLKDQTTASKSAGQSKAAIERAVGQLEVSYQRLSSQIESSALSDKDKQDAQRRLQQQMERSRTTIRNQGTVTEQGARAQVAFRKEVGMTTEAIRRANAAAREQKMANFNKQMRDLSSSVQIALGPLSGVASRLTAFAAVVKRNDVGIASLVSGLVAYTVAMNRVISIGREAERQQLALDSQIRALGLSAFTSGQQMNQMAREIANSTLTSAKEVREAQSVLLEFGNVSTSSFESVLLASQGLAQTFGGGLAANTRRLGRLLENPVENFSALTRQGIQFNEAEKERITTLQRTGRLTEAQSIIMERFTSVIERAKNETGGLSGQLDAIGDNAAMLAEDMFTMGGAGEQAARAAAAVAQAIKDFGESDAGFRLARAFGLTMQGLASTLEFVFDNARALSLIFSTLLARSLMKAGASIAALISQKTGLSALLGRITGQTAAATAAVDQMTAAKGRGAIAARGLGVAIRGVLGPIGVAITLAEVFGATDFFGFHARAREARDLENEIQNLNKGLEDTIGSLREGSIDDMLASIRIDFERQEWQRASDAVTDLQAQYDELNRQRRRAASGRDGSVPTALTRELNQTREALEAAKVAEEERRNVLDLTLKSEQRAAEIRAEQTKAIEDINSSLDDQINKTRQIVDSEGQRIDSMVQSIKEARELLEVAKAQEGADQDRIAALKALIPELEKELAEMRANSRAAREATREAQRLARAQSTMANAIAEATELQRLATGQISEAEYERNRALNDIANSTERYRTALVALNKDSLIAIANSDKLTSEQREFVLGATDQEDMVKRLAQVYKDLGIAALDAQRSIDFQDSFRNVQASTNPLIALQQEYVKQYLAFAQSGGTKAEIEEAQAILARQFEAAFLAEQRNQQRTLEDTLRFTALTDLEQLERSFQDRQQVLREQHHLTEEQVKEHMDNLEREYNRQKMFVGFAQGAQKAADVVDASMQAMSAAGAESTRAYQLMALAQTAISQGMAISKIWGEHASNPAYAGMLTSLAAAQIGAGIAQIKAAGYKDGGFVSGKGTSRSDSIPAWLSNGEFVMNAKAVRQLGTPFLNMLNKGDMPKFNMGGFVGANASAVAPSSSGASVVVIDQSTRVNDVEVSSETSVNAEGIETTRVYIRDTLRDLTASGEMDRTNATNYGLRRRGTRR